MYLISIIIMTAISVILGMGIGIVIRLKERNLPIKMAFYVIYHIYLVTVHFKKFIHENEDSFIEILAASGLEKGTENKKELINERRQEILKVWGDKYIRDYHHRLLKAISKNHDYFIDQVFDTVTEFYTENVRKNHNFNSKSMQKYEIVDYIKGMVPKTNTCI